MQKLINEVAVITGGVVSSSFKTSRYDETVHPAIRRC
jgi:hypothetical protein